MFNFTANNFSLFAVSGKTRAMDFSTGISGENMCLLAVKIMATAVRVVLFGLRYFAGEISILSAHLPLTASCPYFQHEFIKSLLRFWTLDSKFEPHLNHIYGTSTNGTLFLC